MADAPTDWAGLDLTGEPRVLVAKRRASKLLDVRRVEVHEDLFTDLREIATATVGRLDSYERRDYAPFGKLEPHEFYEVLVNELPERRDGRKKEDDPDAVSAASALDLVSRCDEHDALDADQLSTFSTTLYAIVFEIDGQYVGFIRSADPQKHLRPGRLWGNYGDALRKAKPPDLMLDEQVDVVVAGDRCAILNVNKFVSLFGDVGVAFKNVPANVDDLADALRDDLPLSDGALHALRTRCGRRVTDARRLDHIIRERREALPDLTETDLRDLCDRRSLDVVHDAVIGLDDDSAGEFLDLLEGRLFADDITGEARRADAYSSRS